MNNSETQVKTRKKLIEVALPLDTINVASAHEKQPGIGTHPRGLHLWWARRPLATAAAVIFAQVVDDPSAHPETFPTEAAQDKERQRLFSIIEDLVKWKNMTNEDVLEQARDEIWKSWRSTCSDNKNHPRASELFDPEKLPAFHDPFAGGGALPLEAQRLGLEAHASDLNPVAVLINKAMIEIPPKFADWLPVNPKASEANRERNIAREWKGVQGLAEDVRYYGQWMRDEAEKRIGHLYPKVAVTAEMARMRPDLKQYAGKSLTVITWLWARTVKSPNPAFTNVDVPLVTTFMLSTKTGKEAAYVEPVIENGGYRFTVKVGEPEDEEAAKNGTKLSRGSNFRCLMSGTPIAGDYIKSEGRAGRMGARLMAIVAQGTRGRVYLTPTPEHESAARNAKSQWKPETPIGNDPRALWTPPYGLTTYGDLFTDRQLVALTTFSDLVTEALDQVKRDAVAAGMADDGIGIDSGGAGTTAYAEAVGMYLGFAISRLADFNSSIATWKPSGEQVMQTFKRQAIPMTWDFPESNALGHSAICWQNCVKYTAESLENTGRVPSPAGFAAQLDAGREHVSEKKIVSTDPPYYDNIGYADLSDFFYVWLRRSLGSIFPDLFATLAVPKVEELIASPYRQGSKAQAEMFFLDGMTQAMRHLAEQAHPAFPVTIYYAFKQSETKADAGAIRTGWETFLNAVVLSGFTISGTWPMRTELANRMIGLGTNALASSVVLVCRQQAVDAPTTTRREFAALLRDEMPKAVARLESANIAPVDLAQTVIGPGMAIYTRYAKVLDASGEPMSVGDALALINQTIGEVLTEQEGDLDADSRWALTWFEQQGFSEGEFGIATTLSTAKNTSVEGMADAGILVSGRGKVRLLRPDELPEDWDPTTDRRTPAWESVHHLVRALEAGGERAAAELMSKLGAGRSEAARELAYRLYTICERKNWAKEALSYNALVQSWPEIARMEQQELAAEKPRLF